MPMCLEFTSHEVIIDASIDSPTRVEEELCRYCFNALVVHSPASFRGQVTYSNAPKVITAEVAISRAVDIPLLNEIGATTSPTSRKRKKSPFEAHVSIWGLISLLLISEGVVSMQEWLGRPHCRSELANQTLQVCSALYAQPATHCVPLRSLLWILVMLKTVLDI